MEIRPLVETDYSLGYLDLICQLSNTIKSTVSLEDFSARIKKIREQNGQIYVIVLDDKLLASGTLLIESKFIHDLGQVGHIEDIVVEKNSRGQGLAQKITNFLISKAFEKGCYKVILDCQERHCRLYEKCGLSQKQVQMSIYLD